MTWVAITIKDRWRLRVQADEDSLKLGKAHGFDGIPNKCLRHLPRRPLIRLIHHCHFLASWKEAKIITLLKPGKDPKFTSNQPLVHYGELTEKLILRTIQQH
jgi:hypothetical protein